MDSELRLLGGMGEDAYDDAYLYPVTLQEDYKPDILDKSCLLISMVLMALSMGLLYTLDSDHLRQTNSTFPTTLWDDSSQFPISEIITNNVNTDTQLTDLVLSSHHIIHFPSEWKDYYQQENFWCNYVPKKDARIYSLPEIEECIETKRKEYRVSISNITTAPSFVSQMKEWDKCPLDSPVEKGTKVLGKGVHRRKVYDSFVFNNELPLLNIRLNELEHLVHRFVIVESGITFSGLNKPLHFMANARQFEPFLSKIAHVNCDLSSLKLDLNSSDDDRGWPREYTSRDCVALGIDPFADNNDLLIHCDIDELPKPEVIYALRECGEMFDTLLAPMARESFVISGTRFLASYRWKDKAFHEQGGCTVTSVGQVRNHGLVNSVRRIFRHSIHLKEAQWHCSSCFFGNADMMKNKFMSWSEIAISKKFLDSPDYFTEMQSGDCRKAKFDGWRCEYYPHFDQLPLYIRLNPDKFTGYIPDENT